MDTIQKVNVFDKELALIKDSKIKKFTKEIIKSADDWFFLEPASSSGKYHPKFAREAGGLVLHTKAVVYFLKELLRSELYSINEYEKDMLILSAIAHDIKKYGEKENTGHTLANHPELAVKYVTNINKNGKFVNDDDLSYICKCISRHMGVFGDDKPESEAEKLLHISDLLASRKEIDIEFSKEEKKTATPSLDEYIVDFGKHIGKPIREVPIDYLEWAIENITKKPVFLSLAKQVLKENKNEESNK